MLRWQKSGIFNIAWVWRLPRTKNARNAGNVNGYVSGNPITFNNCYVSRIYTVWSAQSIGKLGIPPWTFLCQKMTAISSCRSLEFWCSEEHLASIRPNFDPVSTNSDLFQTILPGRPDLFSPIPTYFAGRTWPIFAYLDLFRFTMRLHGAGHLSEMLNGATHRAFTL